MSALEYEFETELEGELEAEWESELEGEEFIGAIAPLVAQLGPQLLRTLGPQVARAALGAGMRSVGGSPGRGRPRRQREAEWEWEGEEEALLNPVRRVYPDAMMEHFGHAAAQAESEAEAEAFVGALVPLAARLIPTAASALTRAAPALVRGVSAVTRTLHANPATRQLVRTVPTIVRRTAADVARQVSQGRPVTPQTAVRSLAQQTSRVLSNPRQCQQALRRNAQADRRYHRAARSCSNCLAT